MVIFHNIGLDRLVNSYRDPVVVNRTVTYASCPGTRHVMELDNITNSVLVTAGGSLTFRNMTLQVRSGARSGGCRCAGQHRQLPSWPQQCVCCCALLRVAARSAAGCIHVPFAQH